MNDFSDMPTIVTGTYQHYKGNRYRVLGIGCHSETNEYFVAYSPLYEHAGKPDIWLRPYAMFMDNIEIDGVLTPRFKKVADE